MRLSDFLRDIGRPVAYYPALTKITGGAGHTLLLCQLLYWTGKESGEEGWIYKTQEELTHETGLSRREQETARTHLKHAGMLLEKYKGMPRKLFYKVDLEALNIAWGEQAIMAENANMESANQPGNNGGKRHAAPISTETTAENTTENEGRTVDEPFRAIMREKYAGILTEIDQRIDEALGHVNAKKWSNKQLYVQGWLRRDAKWETGGSNGKPGSNAEGNRRPRAIYTIPVDADGKPILGSRPSTMLPMQ